MGSIDRKWNQSARAFRLCLAFVLCLVALLAGCHKPERQPVLDMETFAELYAAAALMRAQGDSARAATRIDSLLQARAVSSQQLREAVQYYQQDQERWVEVWRLITKNLEDSSAVARALAPN